MPNFKVLFSIRIITINPIIKKVGELVRSIQDNRLYGFRIFSKMKETDGKPAYRFMMKLDRSNPGRFDPPLNMNVYPKYVPDELNRNVKPIIFNICSNI